MRPGSWAPGRSHRPGLKAGAFDTVFEGSYADRVITASRIDVTHHTSRAHVDGVGTIGIVSNGPRLDLHGAWRDFRWPLVGAEPAVRSASGDYALSGVWPFDLRATGQLVPAGLDPMQLEMEGQLAKDRVTFKSLAAEAFDGQAVLSGEVLWAPQERWSVTGDASDINPGRLRKDLPGKLDFGITASGLGFGGDGDFSVDIRDLRGRLRGTPASGAGHIARKAHTWEFDQASLVLGGTRLAADGTVADTVDLRFTVDSEDLSLLAKDSRGKLRSQGTLRGTLQDPIIDATLRGSGIQHEGMTLESVEGTVNFDASGAKPSNVAIRARNLVYRERTMSDFSLMLDGTAADHVAHITAKATGLALDSEFTGAFAHGVWLGKVRKLSANGTRVAAPRAGFAGGRAAVGRPFARGVVLPERQARARVRGCGLGPGEVVRDGERERSADQHAYLRSHAVGGLSRNAHHHRARVRWGRTSPCRATCARISWMRPSRISSRAGERSASRSAPGSSR